LATTGTTASSFNDFIRSGRAQAKKPSAEIYSRWASRIVARGLHRQGRAGAETYLRDYGRGISAAKVIAFALVAEAESCPDLAAEFWAAAFTLVTGDLPVRSTVTPSASATPASPASRATKRRCPTMAGLPPHLQPGCIITQQPVDAKHPRQHYCDVPAYIGQPKRDGNRIVLIASPDAVYYQSRSMSLQPAPDSMFDEACRDRAAVRGAFVLDGERVFIDSAGGEHRTGAQAAQTNTDLGTPSRAVICRLCIFKALFADGCDLTTEPEHHRIETAQSLVRSLQGIHAGMPKSEAPSFQIEMLETAQTRAQKRALCDRQQSTGREGEVWIRRDVQYIGGKTSDESIVRTKYLTESTVIVRSLTGTMASGRAFGAIEVEEENQDGSRTEVGSVGTGFSQSVAAEIRKRHLRQPGRLRIKVRHQGRTENGQLWHARFIGFAEK
jgi:bifunctional non-homologous end joining protein LigD